MPQGWSEEAFRARVAARATELGTTVKELLIEAGLDRNTLRPTATGRRIDTLEKLAGACQWTLAELLGLTPTPALHLQAMRLTFEIVTGLGIPIDENIETISEMTLDILRWLERDPVTGMSRVQQQMLVAWMRERLTRGNPHPLPQGSFAAHATLAPPAAARDVVSANPASPEPRHHRALSPANPKPTS